MTNARATKIDKLSNTNCRERIETEQVEDGRGESSQARAEKNNRRDAKRTTSKKYKWKATPAVKIVDLNQMHLMNR